jgi:hypothetical protein
MAESAADAGASRRPLADGTGERVLEEARVPRPRGARGFRLERRFPLERVTKPRPGPDPRLIRIEFDEDMPTRRLATTRVLTGSELIHNDGTTIEGTLDWLRAVLADRLAGSMVSLTDLARTCPYEEALLYEAIGFLVRENRVTVVADQVLVIRSRG